MFKRKPSIQGLTRVRGSEASLIALVESRVDSGAATGGLIEEIVAECRSRVVALPADASWRFLVGRFLMAAGDPIEARDELEQAILLDPLDPRVPAHLGIWYETALVARRGGASNIDLPVLPGPVVSADASKFGLLDERLAPELLRKRSLEFFDAAARFSLPRADARFLRQHIAHTRGLPLVSKELPENVTPMRHVG